MHHVKNNIYIVTVPEEISVAHTGDQWSEEDKKWIDKIKEHIKLEVLLLLLIWGNLQIFPYKYKKGAVLLPFLYLSTWII